MNELSLFSGYGGFNLGFQLAGLKVRTVGYVEWEKYPQEIIKARIRDGYLDDAPIFADIRAFNGIQYRGLVDIITAGFPCQPHSLAGQRKGEADERNLWPDTARVINEVGPRYVLLENVPGLLSGDAGRPPYGGQVIGELSELGYDCQWGVVGARDAGAPHKRERWWCFGVAHPQSEGRQRRGTGEPWLDSQSEALVFGRGSARDGDMARPDNVEYTQHDGYAPGQDAGGFGSRVHPSTGEEQSEQLERSSERHGGTDLLADPDSNRAERSEPEHREGRRVEQNSKRGMADPDSKRGCGRTPDREDAEDAWEPSESQGRNGGIPPWPPGPSDRDSWARVLAERPDLAPAVTKEAESEFRGMADGGANRLDRVNRLKVLGNGIVPPALREFLWRIT